MYKLLKWIYGLGYNNGYRNCSDEVEEQKRNEELFERFMKEQNL